MKPRLLLFDENIDVVANLQSAFRGDAELSARQLEPSEIPTLQELDALYLTLPAAERWNPRLIFYQSQILKTGPGEGWPPHIITGIAMKPDDPRAGDPASELKLVIKAVLDAVESYNHKHQSTITVIGFWTRDLSIDHMDTSLAGKIIRSIYEEFYRQPLV